MPDWPARVEIREVGPRDGLQNEAPVAIVERVRLIDALSGTGLRRIEAAAFGDTTGMATPRRVHELLDALDHAGIDSDRVGLHFHDTRGTALANALAGLERGVTRFDASIGGLGGCPYAPGASGNAVTEDLVHMLEDMGIDTGVDLDALTDCARLAQDIVARELPSALLHAGPRTRRYAS